MNVLLILAAVLLALALISLIRIGVLLHYTGPCLNLTIKVGPVRISILPKKQKEKKEKTEKRKKKKHASQTESPIQKVKKYLPVVSEVGGKLRRKIRIDRFDLDLTVAASDPASAALAYGGANAAVGMIWPLMEQNFNVKERSIFVRADFMSEHPTITLDVTATLTIGQAVVVGVGLLSALSRMEKRGGRGKKSTVSEKEHVQKKAV